MLGWITQLKGITMAVRKLAQPRTQRVPDQYQFESGSLSFDPNGCFIAHNVLFESV